MAEVMRVSRGEIWQFGFPKPHRQRPVLVLTRDDMIGRLNTVTVAPITTTIRGVPSEVIVGEAEGLKRPSAINLHNVATVPAAGLRKYVGAVSDAVLRDVCDALLFSLGFGGEGAKRGRF